MVCDWWTDYFRGILEKHRDDSGKISLIPGLVGAALAERERMERLAAKQRASPTKNQDGPVNPVAKLRPVSQTLQTAHPRGTPPTLTQALDNFKVYLKEVLLEQYHDHWFPESRTKGSAYRLIRLDPSRSRSLGSYLGVAAERAMLGNMIWKIVRERYGLSSVRMWCNPGEVILNRTTFGPNGGIRRETEELFKAETLPPQQTPQTPAEEEREDDAGSQSSEDSSSSAGSLPPEKSSGQRPERGVSPSKASEPNRWSLRSTQGQTGPPGLGVLAA